jgi:sensor domain CHASE-containing protein
VIARTAIVAIVAIARTAIVAIVAIARTAIVAIVAAATANSGYSIQLSRFQDIDLIQENY